MVEEHAHWLKNRIRKNVGKTENKTSPLNVIGLLGGTVDRVIKEGKVDTVGGMVHLMYINENGMFNPKMKIIQKNGTVRDGTRKIFRSYVDMFDDSLLVTPKCDSFGNVSRNNGYWNISTEPGYLTGRKII